MGCVEQLLERQFGVCPGSHLLPRKAHQQVRHACSLQPQQLS